MGGGDVPPPVEDSALKMHNGIVESVPSFGQLDVEFVANLFGQQSPLHTSIYHYFPINLPVAEARNQSVEQALKLECEYVFFRDYDVIAPVNALSVLVTRQLPIVGGLYFSKTKPPFPLLFVDNRPRLDWEPGTLVKVDALGMGCTLIRTELFKKLDPPWFKTGDESVQHSASVVGNSKHTEDTFFCRRLREELGVFPHVDTAVLCDHKDLKTQERFYYDTTFGGPAWSDTDGKVHAIAAAGHPKTKVIDLTKESETE